MSFQSLGNLGKKCEKKIVFCDPLTKIVTPQVGLYSFKEAEK